MSFKYSVILARLYEELRQKRKVLVLDYIIKYNCKLEMHNKKGTEYSM